MKISTFLVGLLSLGVVTALPRKALFAGRNEAFDDCGQNEESGLGPVLQEIWGLIPIGDVLMILAEYLSDDQEVQNAFEFIESDEMAYIVNTISSKKEFIDVMEYFCEELQLNTYFYLNSLGDLLGFPHVTRPPGPTPAFDREPGLRGFWQEVSAILPLEEIREVWWYNRENNPYLDRAILKLQSDTFKVVADGVEALEEFQYMLYRLEQVGFDMEFVIDSMKRWLGWIE